MRELQEECNVAGKIVVKTSEIYEQTHEGMNCHVTYLVDIGEQNPTLGFDPEPELVDNPILQGVGWYSLNIKYIKNYIFTPNNSAALP